LPCAHRAARRRDISDELRSIVLGTAGLTVAGIAAIALGLARGSLDGRIPRHAALAGLVSLVVVVQAAPFSEELATGFDRPFPELLGLVPWSRAFFVVQPLLAAGLGALRGGPGGASPGLVVPALVPRHRRRR
jgi:hypothetical protein